MAKLSELPPPTIVARIAQRIEEITDARERGFSWPAIVRAIGPEIGIDPDGKDVGRKLRLSYAAAKKAIEKGRIVPRPHAGESSPALDGLAPGNGLAPEKAAARLRPKKFGGGFEDLNGR